MIILAGLVITLLALLGVPLFAVIALSAMWGYLREDIDLSALAIEIFGIAEMPILLAIPLFTFAGYLLSEGGAPSRLVRVTQALLGWVPGGLAVIALVACALFTAFTGASGVTIIALGALLYPALKEAGYRENFTLGLVTTSGSLGLLVRAVAAADPLRYRRAGSRGRPVPRGYSARHPDGRDSLGLEFLGEP